MGDEREEQGFTVRDRRVFSPDREAAPTSQESPADSTGPGQRPEASDREARRQEVPLPEPSFSTFLTFFFFQQALMFLGELPNLEGGRQERNLPMAKYLIDTMAIIKEKTRGNLTQDEQRQLETFLTELRMRYVKAVEG